jgi:HSP20 family molecular chaperone IbpA
MSNNYFDSLLTFLTKDLQNPGHDWPIFDHVGTANALADNGRTKPFTVDIPGVKKENVSLELQGYALKLTTTRGKIESSRTIILNKRVDLSTIKSTLEHGVLTVDFKLLADKVAPGEARKIAVDSP